MKSIGFIGIGNIGLPMVNCLIRAGHHVVVHDVRPGFETRLDKGSWTVAANPREVADQAEVVLLSLPVPEAVLAVTLGEQGVAGGKAVKIVVDLSTTGPLVAAEVGKRLEAHGIQLFDAPVSGGVPLATVGRLSIMAAGPTATFETLRPILETLGKPVLVGDRPGQGHTMKLLNNLLSGNALAATAEVVVLGVKAGMDARKIIEVLNASSGRNSATQDKFPASVLTRNFNFGFSTRLVHKDVRLGCELAAQLGAQLPIGNAVERAWDSAEKVLGDEDYTKIVLLLEQAAGVTVAPEAAARA